MAGETTKGCPITLFVPGPSSDASGAVEAAGGGRWRVEWIENDGHFVEAFRFGAFDADVFAKLARCPGALIVEGEVALPDETRALLDLGRVIESVGALGIRVEQSMAAWSVERWLGGLEPGQLVATLTVLLRDVDCVETCGMHVFARPDVRVLTDSAGEGERVATSLCSFQLWEDPVLLPGHTFRPDDETPRRVLDWQPDDRRPASHPCHNPFGILVLGAPKRAAPGKLTFTFMPALMVTLEATEARAGRPLERAEVEAIRDEAPCIAMEHRDAQMFARSRGYADIDPERAWEHWQIVRAGLAAG